MRAETLLDATNRFLEATDVEELLATVADSTIAMFAADRVLLTIFDEEGKLELVHPRGYARADLDRIRVHLAAGTTFALRALEGEDLWTDDETEVDFRERSSAFGLGAAFLVPIRSKHATRGVLSVGYVAERTFDRSFRESARSLAGQVGLALELLLTRDDLRASEAALASQARRSEALLEVSGQLTSIINAKEIAPTLARAVRRATGVSIAIIARWDETAGEATVLATSGLSHAQERLASRTRPNRSWGIVERAIEGSIELIARPIDPSDFPVALFDHWDLSAAALARIAGLGSTWGFIALGFRPDDEIAPEVIREMLRGLAGIASAAVGRVEAFTALARQAELLEFRVAERTMQLEQAVVELESASQAKTAFLANVSHELRTPLTAILGFSDVLVNGLDGPLAPDQYEDVRTIHASSRHLLALIDDLIDIQQIEARRIVLHPERVDARALLSTAVDELRPLAGTRGIALDLHLSTELDTVVADPARFRQIVLNLLANAVKFTRPGGKVRLIGELEAVEAVETLVVGVEDSGIGIAVADQARIFEKFQRVAAVEYPGTGLGLSISRELARLHGGDVTVESTLGLGSRFTLRIPVGTGPG